MNRVIGDIYKTNIGTAHKYGLNTQSGTKEPRKEKKGIVGRVDDKNGLKEA